MTSTDMDAKSIRINLSHLAEDHGGIRWCLWCYEEIDGKKKKVPKQRSGVTARTNLPKHCCTFEEAVAAFETGEHRFDGVGLVLGDGLFAVDLDGCLDADGVLALHAAEIVQRFKSRTEVTPSEVGLRILFKLNDPSLLPSNTVIYSSIDGKPHSEVKVMARGYVTVTGQALEGTPTEIVVADEALIWLLAKKTVRTKSGGSAERSRSHEEPVPCAEPIPPVSGERANDLNRDISRMLRWDPVFRESWHQRSINHKAGLTLSDFGVALVAHAVARNQDWDVSDVRYLINTWSRCGKLAYQHDSRVKSWFLTGLTNREVYVNKSLAKLVASAPGLVDIPNSLTTTLSCVYTLQCHNLKSLNLDLNLGTDLNSDLVALNKARSDNKPRKPGKKPSCTCACCNVCRARVRQQTSRFRRDDYFHALYQRHLKFGMGMDFWKAGHDDAPYSDPTDPICTAHGPDPTFKDWMEWLRFAVTDQGLEAYEQDLDSAEFIARATAIEAATEKRRWEQEWTAQQLLGLLLRPLIEISRPSLSSQAAFGEAMNVVSNHLHMEDVFSQRSPATELMSAIEWERKQLESTVRKHAPLSSPGEISAKALMGAFIKVYFTDERFSFIRAELKQDRSLIRGEKR
jgi:hypothetical protein